MGYRGLNMVRSEALQNSRQHLKMVQPVHTARKWVLFPQQVPRSLRNSYTRKIHFPQALWQGAAKTLVMFLVSGSAEQRVAELFPAMRGHLHKIIDTRREHRVVFLVQRIKLPLLIPQPAVRPLKLCTPVMGLLLGILKLALQNYFLQ